MKIFKGTGTVFFLCIGTRLQPNNSSLSPSTIQQNPMKHDKTRPSRTMKRPYLSILKNYNEALPWFISLPIPSHVDISVADFTKNLSPDGASSGAIQPI